MNGFAGALAQTSLSASAAILLLLALSRLLRGKTPPGFRLICWLAVALSLLVPLRPFTLTAPSFLPSPAARPEQPEPAGADWPSDSAAAGGADAPQTDRPPEPRAGTGRAPFDMTGSLPYLWAAGFLGVMSLSIVRQARFLRLARRWGRPAPAPVLALMEQVRQEVGLKRPVRLLVSPVVPAPALAGLFRPVVLLPAGPAEAAKLRFILMHEALHRKRGDNFGKALTLLAAAAHWFNPLVWLMKRAAAEECEAACDLAVLRRAGYGERFRYAEAVLLAVKRGGQTETALASAFRRSGENLRKRLDGIIGRPAPKRWVSLCCAVLLLLPPALSGVRMGPAGAAAGGGPPGLKDIYKEYFLIGTCGDARALNGRYGELVARHFNAFTFENEMKPGQIQSREGRFSFARVDEMAGKLQEGGIAAVGHTLAFHQQTPDWMWEDQEKARARLEAHIDAVIRHSGPYLASVDVVNEAFKDNAGGGGWRDALREEGWFSVLGADFIEIAFRKADEARRAIGRPDLKLYYNDYGLESHGKASAVYHMVAELREKGVPVDGVGMQAHCSPNTPAGKARFALALFSAVPGLEVSISELDVAVPPGGGDEAQARHYAALFALYKEYAAGPANPDPSKRLIARVTLWGVTDAVSWRGGAPLLFDREFNPKEAYHAAADPEGYLNASRVL